MNIKYRKNLSVVLLILAILLLNPSVLGLIEGMKFNLSINNIISMLCLIAAVIIRFAFKNKQ